MPLRGPQPHLIVPPGGLRLRPVQDYEERIAPLLDALGRDLEAAASRSSAGSGYQKGGDLSRAANLYQVARAAPLRPNIRRHVEAMLAGCLDELGRTALNVSPWQQGKVPTGT